MKFYISLYIYAYIFSHVFLYIATIHYLHIKVAVAQPRRGTNVPRLPHDSHEPKKRLRKQIASHNHSNADPPSQPSGCSPQPPSCTLRNVSFPQRRDQIKRIPSHTWNNFILRNRNHPIHKDAKTSDHLRSDQVPCPDQPPLPSADALGDFSNPRRLDNCPS